MSFHGRESHLESCFTWHATPLFVFFYATAVVRDAVRIRTTRTFCTNSSVTSACAVVDIISQPTPPVNVYFPSPVPPCSERRDVFQDAYHSFMPSYQDYVVARDDLDPNTPVTGTTRAPGGGGGGVARPAGGSGGKESRVVRTRTFLIGNLDRGNMSKPTLSADGTTQVICVAVDAGGGGR